MGLPDGDENSKIWDVSSGVGRKEVLCLEGLQLQRDKEGDEAQQNAQQEDVGNEMAAQGLKAGHHSFIWNELELRKINIKGRSWDSLNSKIWDVGSDENRKEVLSPEGPSASTR